MSTTETITTTSETPAKETKQESHGSLNVEGQDAYRYAHLLPTFTPSSYPPLTPFEHVDPGHRALSHSDPTAFLASATSVADITPTLGTEVRGVNLTRLSSDERDELALFVARRGLAVFRGMHELPIT
jgi:sulfonate dioxygenase